MVPLPSFAFSKTEGITISYITGVFWGVLNRVYFRGVITKCVSFASGYSHLGKTDRMDREGLEAQATHQG